MGAYIQPYLANILARAYVGSENATTLIKQQTPRLHRVMIVSPKQRLALQLILVIA